MGEQQDAFSYQGIERVIPLRVIMVQPTNASADQVTWDNLVQSVRVANDAFRAAGVQFRLRSVRRYTMPNFANDLTAASPGYTVAKLTWADAKADLDLAFGNISGFPSLPSSTYLKFKKEWLFYASTRFAPSDEHVVWVVGANGCCHESAVTYHARGTIMVGGGMANWSKLAHELGHSYGLMHSLGTTPAANMQCDPSGASECDMYNPPLVSTTLADFWDQVYKPGTNATTDPHKTFNNRTEANAELSNLKWIFDGANCTTSYTGAGSISCSITTGYSETWTTANAYGQNRLKGLAFPFPGGKFSGNAIVSNLEPVNNAANTWPVSFSSSQIDLIRKNLRYDTKIQSGAETDLASLGLTGGRPMLGQLLRREPLADLDFDGDGKRDIAMWFASSGEFNYKKSSSSWAQSVISLGQVGDIPVPADYNGDGYSFTESLRLRQVGRKIKGLDIGFKQTSYKGLRANPLNLR